MSTYRIKEIGHIAATWGAYELGMPLNWHQETRRGFSHFNCAYSTIPADFAQMAGYQKFQFNNKSASVGLYWK